MEEDTPGGTRERVTMLRRGASKVVGSLGWGMGTCWFGIKLTFSVRARY